MARLFGFFLRRRLARFLPGGWAAFLVASPTVRRLAMSGFRRARQRRRARRGPPLA